MLNHKSQITNSKLQTKPKIEFKKIYDLEERTLEFAKTAIKLCGKMPFRTVTTELTKQLTRSSASIGANYREANEALSKRGFIHRMSITRKEAKETSYWLELLKEVHPEFNPEIALLAREVQELRNIFTAIINKTK